MDNELGYDQEKCYPYDLLYYKELQSANKSNSVDTRNHSPTPTPPSSSCKEIHTNIITDIPIPIPPSSISGSLPSSQCIIDKFTVDTDLLVLIGVSGIPSSETSSNYYTRFISGFCNLAIFKGVGVVNGYTCSNGKPLRIDCPIWTPAIQLDLFTATAVAATSKKKSKNSSRSSSSGKSKSISISFLTQFILSIDRYNLRRKFPNLFGNETKITEFIDRYDAIYLMQGISYDEQEWLIRAEDKTVYSMNRHANNDRVISVASSILTTSSEMCKLGINTTYIDDTWSKSIDTVVNSSNKVYRDTRMIVCGAKGVGKSTCLRYSINRLLSKKSKLLCVIDCDVGQPECSPPGMISLFIIEDPILSPPHMHMSTPFLSYYIGDVTTKGEPILVTECIQKLYNAYLKVRKVYEVTSKVPTTYDDIDNVTTTTTTATASRSNIFSVFDDDSDEDDDNSHDDSCNRSLPLLVNTDGFVRYIGAEVLCNICNICNPTHVMHISTTKDRDLPALQLLAVNNTKCVIFTVNPGSTVASSIAAIDLRILRLVSYFLRYNSSLIDSAYDSSSCSSSSSSNSSSSTSSSSKGLYIRNGAIVDLMGCIASVFTSCNCYSVPFDTVSLRCNSNTIPDHLLLAAINSSIVGITDNSDGSVCKHLINLKAPSSKTCFTIDCDGTILTQLLPCKGLAVVKGVDVHNENIYIITPCAASAPTLNSNGTDSNNNHVCDKVCIVKSNILMPNVMTYLPSLPFCSYMSGESHGEGSAVMKSRSNLKRKSQRNN